VKDWNSGVIAKRGVDQEVIISPAADARIGIKTGQYGIPVLCFRINLLGETGIIALVFEITEGGFVVLGKSHMRNQIKDKDKF
jgi:hypothetical protein